MPLSVIDRLRDRVDRRIQHGDAVSSWTVRSSQVLRDAAHAVERVPVLRRGEDPSTSR